MFSIKQLLNPENCQLQKLPVNLHLHWLKTPTTKGSCTYISIIEGVALWLTCELVAPRMICFWNNKLRIWRYRLYRIFSSVWVSQYLTTPYSGSVLHYIQYFAIPFYISLLKSSILDGDVKGNQSRSASSFQKTARLYHRYPQFHSLMGCALSCMRRPTQRARRLVPAWCTKSKPLKTQHTEAMASCCWVHVEFGLRMRDT